MTIKLKNDSFKMDNFVAKRDVFVNLLKENDDQEKQDAAYLDMVNAMAEDARLAAEDAANRKFDELNSFSNTGLSSEEVKFFNAINTEVGYKEETLLPQTTIDKIFEDLVQEHPLLAEIGLQTTGLRMRILKSDPSGQAVWGKIFSEIRGQLDAAFSEEEITQSKLTAFVVVPNDLEQYGPVWVERYVRAQITEAFAVALEAALVAGDGKDKPIGLNRDVSADAAVVDGVYPEKTPAGTLTFADSDTTVSELSGLMKGLSTKENGKSVNVSGKVVMLVNPENAWDIKAQHTSQNAAGAYITAMPFNIRIIESEFVPAGQVIPFVSGRYDAYIGGGVAVKKFDQTLALEDATLYTAKQFAFGKAQDDNASAVYTLNIGTEAV